MNRRLTIGTLAAAALLALPATGSAAGSQTVIQAIKAQDKIVKSNPEYKSLGNLKINSVAQAKAAIPKLKSLESVLNTAGSDVAKATATAKQKAGQKDWVAGAHEDAKGVGELATALQDLVNGNKTAAQKAATSAEKLVKAATAIGNKGDKLLGLSTND